MNLTLYQILVLTVCLVFIFKAFSHFIRGEQTVREIVAIYFFWSGISFFALFPNAFQEVANILGFKEYVTAVIFFVVSILVYGVFKLFLYSDRSRKEITELVRKLALKDADSNEKK